MTSYFQDLSLEEWKNLSKDLTLKQIYYGELKDKKRLTRREKFKIEKKLRIMEYYLWLTSPHLKNKPLLQEKVYSDCLLDFNRFQVRNKGI